MSLLTASHHLDCSSRQLNIAGITVLINIENHPLLNPEPNISYSEFEQNVCNPSSQRDIPVTIQCAPGPIYPDEELSLIYQTDASWTLYSFQDKIIVRLQHPDNHITMWEAETNSDFSEMVVHVQVPRSSDTVPHKNKYPFRYPLDQILLMHYLGTRKGFIVHSAGMLIQDKMYVFPGISGAGKSTITKCFLQDERFQVINDDRMIIRFQNDTFRAYGTPWPGEAGISTNINEKLGGLFFLNKAPESRIEKLSSQETFEKLMPVASIPWHDKKIVLSLLDFCEQLVQNIPAYNLFFTPSSDLGDLILDTVN